jgi:hypothetical protein
MHPTHTFFLASCSLLHGQTGKSNPRVVKQKKKKGKKKKEGKQKEKAPSKDQRQTRKVSYQLIFLLKIFNFFRQSQQFQTEACGRSHWPSILYTVGTSLLAFDAENTFPEGEGSAVH